MANPRDKRFTWLHYRKLRRLVLRKNCGARTKRDGKPCQAKAMRNGRCKWHGGMSTGPRSAVGKRRALANLKQFRR